MDGNLAFTTSFIMMKQQYKNYHGSVFKQGIIRLLFKED